MKETLDYYNQHAQAYIDSTRDIAFSQTQDRFLAYLRPGDRILDFGCGSGRDTRYFLEKGYRVEAVDGSEEFVKSASSYTGIKVRQLLFQDLDAEAAYDGIWACSSILHLTYGELVDVFGKMGRALDIGGILYTSFKYGTYEGKREDRYFTDMTEEKMEGLLNTAGIFDIEEMWVTSDARPGRSEEKWLNMILRKH